jgi:hypothetical protein
MKKVIAARKKSLVSHLVFDGDVHHVPPPVMPENIRTIDAFAFLPIQDDTIFVGRFDLIEDIGHHFRGHVRAFRRGGQDGGPILRGACGKGCEPDAQRKQQASTQEKEVPGQNQHGRHDGMCVGELQ